MDVFELSLSALLTIPHGGIAYAINGNMSVRFRFYHAMILFYVCLFFFVIRSGSNNTPMAMTKMMIVFLMSLRVCVHDAVVVDVVVLMILLI